MSQNTTVLAALKSHQLTQFEALKRHGIMRLASRIEELRDSYEIETHMVKRNGKRFASYQLIGEKKCK